MYIYSRKNITQLIINKNQKHNISINQINFDENNDQDMVRLWQRLVIDSPTLL